MQFITIATEDELSEAVGDRLIATFLPTFEVNQRLRRGGNGYLRTKCRDFNKMAHRHPVLMITDLDKIECPVELIKAWFDDSPRNANLIFRVAVREIESWLLADHEGMEQLLKKGGINLAVNPDTLPEPKEYLLNRAKRAPRDVKVDLVRAKGTVARQGLGYNARLCEFTRHVWAPARASERSESLARAIKRLSEVE